MKKTLNITEFNQIARLSLRFLGSRYTVSNLLRIYFVLTIRALSWGKAEEADYINNMEYGVAEFLN